MIQKSFSIICDDNEAIHGDIRFRQDGSFPIICILHGFKGFKDWAFFPHIATELTKQGAITFCANTSLNGHAPGSDIVDYPDSFARNTISREISDLSRMISLILSCDDSVFAQDWKQCWNGELYILGHSRGGGIAILLSSLFPEIKKVALWNSIAAFDRYTSRQKEQWLKNGKFVVENSRTGQALAMNVSYLQDILLHAELYSLERAMHDSQARFLIVHAEQDMTVPLRDGQLLAEYASNKAMLHIIPQTGHTFGTVHPMHEIPVGLHQALQATKEFFSV